MTPARFKQIRRLLWLYFWLLIFEGALRKWVLPGLANPLLLVREPVALLALYLSWPLLSKPQWQVWLQPLFVIGPLAFALAITAGHGDFLTALYGTRVLVIQLPLIFVFASVFDRDDVIRFSWVMLWLSIAMTILIVLQSNQPDSHILNVGAGGIGTASFQGALDRSRPSGTFSFITGIAAFYALAASNLFVILYNTTIKTRGRIFCILSGVSLVVALPVSISRTLLANYIMVIVALVAATVLSRTRLQPLLSGLVALTMAIGISTTIPAFQDTSDAFLSRWSDAAASSGDVRDEVGDVGIATGQIHRRVLPGFITPFQHLGDLPILGHGIGMGSNVGIQRLGLQGFALGEGGWEVSFGELGVMLGLTFVIWRITLSIWLLRMAQQAAIRGNKSPLILAGSSVLILLNGQLSQPTGLGFIVLLGGLTLAACNNPSSPPASVGRAVTNQNFTTLLPTSRNYYS
jgi:hypothetical protein